MLMVKIVVAAGLSFLEFVQSKNQKAFISIIALRAGARLQESEPGRVLL